jgi:hypothetical protein
VKLAAVGKVAARLREAAAVAGAPRGDDELRRVRMDACAGRREGTAGPLQIAQLAHLSRIIFLSWVVANSFEITYPFGFFWGYLG